MKCAVIIPVGPGHQDDYATCARTVEQAWARGRGPFTALELLPMWDLQGAHGRSARRNDGIALAREKGCDWLFFLDADDLMNSSAFERMAPYHDRYDAVWGNICESAYGSNQFALRAGQLTKTQDLADILRWDPYYTLQMGHFVRTACAAEVGFDTTMDTGEDFKYYLGLWERFRCAKVEEIFFINQQGHHSTGPRSANGAQWRDAVTALLHDAITRHPLVMKVTLDGKTAHFAVTSPADDIQRCHYQGSYFEPAQLASLKTLVGLGKTIVDLGANVGNHVVFYAQHMDAARIYPFEDNPDRVAVLDRNIQLNGLDGVVDRRGLGRTVGRTRIAGLPVPTAGAADAAVVSLDEVLADAKIDFIRAVGGDHLFDALDGAKTVIAANRPLMYVTLTNDQVPAFNAWMAANNYGLQGLTRRPDGVSAFVGPQ